MNITRFHDEDKYVLFKHHNLYLPVENKDHINILDFKLEEKDATECEVLHEVLVNVSKLTHESSYKGHLWIKCDKIRYLNIKDSRIKLRTTKVMKI